MSFTFDNLPDNASSTVGAAGYTAGSGSLAVATGTGAVFGSSFPLQVSTFKQGTNAPCGIYRATGRSADTLTGLTLIGGTDTALSSGDIVAARWTSEAYQALCTAINQVNATFASYAPLASPALTGTPTAPTPATSDNSTAIATAAFVKAQSYVNAAGAAAAAPVQSVAGRTGAVTIGFADLSGTASIAQGGTGATTQQAAIDALTGTQSAGKYLRSDGTHATLSSVVAADLPGFDASGNGFPERMTFLLGIGADVANAANATGTRWIATHPGKLQAWKIDPQTNPAGGGFTVDLLKNGVSVLSAPIAVAANTTAIQAGNTFAAATVAAGDVFSVNVSGAGTGVRNVNVTVAVLSTNG